MGDAMQESSIWETLLVDFSLRKKTGDLTLLAMMELV